ncbi:hypothetical protein FHG87_015383 [Trinorchestia longiramus]|nr:hypothetical protein FHG87_015383 [Trinorchestia longiramus]
MRELEERESALEDAQLQLTTARELVRELREELATAETRADQHASAVQEKEVSTLISDKRKLQEEVDELKNKLTSLSSHVDVGGDGFMRLSDANLDLQRQLDSKAQQLCFIQNDKDQLSEKVEVLEARISEALDELKQKCIMLEEKDKALIDSSNLLKGKECELSDLNEVLSDLKEQINLLREQLTVKIEETSKMQKELEKSRNEVKSSPEVESDPSKMTSLTEQENLNAELVTSRHRALEHILLEEQKVKNEELQSEVERVREEFLCGQRTLEKRLSEAEEALLVQVAESNNKAAALIEARDRNTELEELNHEKSKSLLEMENLKNELEKLIEQKTMSDEQAMMVETRLNSTISQLESKLNNTVVELSDLNKVHSELLTEKQEQDRMFSVEKEKLMQQMAENKKLHISASRYKDCELLSAKKETEDVRQQLCKLREEKIGAEKLCGALTTEHEAKLDHLAQQFREVSREKETLSEEIAAVRETVKSQTEDMEKLRDEISSLEERLSSVTTTHLEELNALKREKQMLEQKLEETHVLVSTSATEKDNEKLNKLKEDLKRSKEACQMLQKESAAVREARLQEVQELSELRTQLALLQKASTAKDEEILVLQTEVKKALACSVMPASTSIASASLSDTSCKVKQEPSVEEVLKEKLRAKESEVCELMHKLSLTQDHTLATNNITSATSSSFPPHSVTSEPLPPPSTSYAHKMDASESDSSVLSTPAPVKKRRGRPKTPCNSSGSRLQAPSEPNSSIRRSARCTRSASTLTGEASDGDEFSSESYEPPRRGGRRGAASSRRTIRSKKLPPRLVNPHLESNKENRIRVRTNGG